jgi:hypothetical protein
MQNRNNTIEERLQIINDYIQRTMDALNATRQVVQGLSTSTNVVDQRFVPSTGISHSSFYGIPQQFVQTPYGLVAVDARQFSSFSPYNYGLNYGLHHSQFVPQFQTWPMNVSQYGIPQVLPQLNYGWQTGLNHTAFLPQVQGAWQMPIQQLPIQNTLGTFGLNQVVPQTVQGQTL